MATQGPESFARLRARVDGELEEISVRLRSLARAQDHFHGLLGAFHALTGELELPVLLQTLLRTAQDLVGARYGAIGVLDASGDALSDFIPVGLDEDERRALAHVELPRGRGLLGHLIRDPEPLRVDAISEHPESVGFPSGHPDMTRLLGVSIRGRHGVYGNLYLADRTDGLAFDEHDEAVLTALASAAAVAIDNARLFQSVREGAERFQRLLVPRLPDLSPYEAHAVYRPAGTLGHHVGGDWYDAMRLPDGSCAMMIGDVVGHDLHAAAAMAQTRNMLRALLYELRGPPSSALWRMDRIQQAITDLPVATACLVRIHRAGEGRYRMHWTSAGHLPPLVVDPGGSARVLSGEPGLPIGVDPGHPRPDHGLALAPGSTVVLYTDGLVESRGEALDAGLTALERAAAPLARAPLGRFCDALADLRPAPGGDDTAILALRVPPG
ncbi:PP2C family protein-serine/threonine phosphatase [Streptomyces sanyensis]|uniref:PP2C family protein-serine/threonine phosphatase n=1 Tax=Streptomyces sanyensis TaxID=568869 RepID=UPI003D783F14